MQVVIMAAGRGHRMGSLTDHTPKPMLQVLGKNLLEYKLDALPHMIDEVIFVVGYLGSEIHNFFGGEYKGRRILYVEQDRQAGTADALWQAKDVLHDRFLVLNGDDIYGASDLTALCAGSDWNMLVHSVPDAYSGGIVEIVGDYSIIADIVEHQGVMLGDKACTNAYILDTRVFDAPLVPKAPGSLEFGLPQTVLAAAKQMNIPFHAVEGDFWIQITSPSDLSKAGEILNEVAKK